MSEKRNKYDTDPLDPDFVRRTDEIMGTTATSDVAGERATEHFAQPAAKPEEPTRRFEEATRRLEDSPSRNAEYLAGSYPSVFVPPTYQPPATSQPAYRAATPPPPVTANAPRIPHSEKLRPTGRHLPGLGLPENFAMVLPYAPMYIGLVAALIELMLVPRGEYRTRFHAAQGLALQLAIAGISALFYIISLATHSGTGGGFFKFAAFIFLIISMIRVWKGEPHRIAPLEDITRQINQRFEPRK